MRELAPANIKGTRWLSPCGREIHEVLAVYFAGTENENLHLSVEDAKTGDVARGFIVQTYHDVVWCCTPVETK